MKKSENVALFLVKLVVLVVVLAGVWLALGYLSHKSYEDKINAQLAIQDLACQQYENEASWGQQVEIPFYCEDYFKAYFTVENKSTTSSYLALNYRITNAVNGRLYYAGKTIGGNTLEYTIAYAPCNEKMRITFYNDSANLGIVTGKTDEFEVFHVCSHEEPGMDIDFHRYGV